MRGFPRTASSTRRSRIGCAATPRRLKNVETFVVGKPRNEETAKAAGQMAVEGAVTLRHNGYKVPLMRNLVARALRAPSAAPRTT